MVSSPFGWIHDHKGVIAAEATAVGIVAIEVKIKVDVRTGFGSVRRRVLMPVGGAVHGEHFGSRY